MNTKDNQPENEVYFLGSKEEDKPKKSKKQLWVVWVICALLVLLGAFFLYLYFSPKEPEYYFEPESELEIKTETEQTTVQPPSDLQDSIKKEMGYIEVLEETINDVPLYIYVPHHAHARLTLSKPDPSDLTLIFVAQAADVRADNLDIVGDFVLQGRQLARGVAKVGFCAIIDNQITLGASKQTPLLQKAIESKGFFFRQYPLVNEGQLVENNPKNKSIRRAIAVRDHQVVLIESRSSESFHDFSQALIDIGVSQAIYLVGGNAYGWYFDQEKNRKEFGIEKDDMPKNTSYLIWESN